MNMNTTKRDMVEKWLIDNQAVINAAGLDKRLGFPSGTLQKFLKYDRKLNNKRIIKLFSFIERICLRSFSEMKEKPKSL